MIIETTSHIASPEPPSGGLDKLTDVPYSILRSKVHPVEDIDALSTHDMVDPESKWETQWLRTMSSDTLQALWAEKSAHEDWAERLTAERMVIDADLRGLKIINTLEEFGPIIQGPLREGHALVLEEYLEHALGAAMLQTPSPDMD